MEAEESPTSFNCSDAKTDIEKTVCTVPELAALDKQMASLYRARLARLPDDRNKSFRQQQEDWLKQRNQCNDHFDPGHRCLFGVYYARINEINQMDHLDSSRSDKAAMVQKFYPGTYEGIAYHEPSSDNPHLEVSFREKEGLLLHNYPYVPLAFDSAQNRWVSKDTKEITCPHRQPEKIGPDDVTAYPGAADSIMSDGCLWQEVILTDKSYAIVIQTTCEWPASSNFHDALDTLKLIGPIHSVVVPCK